MPYAEAVVERAMKLQQVILRANCYISTAVRTPGWRCVPTRGRHSSACWRLLYAQLWPAETLHAVLNALAHLVRHWGVAHALYTDRARWAFVTPKAGGPVDRTQLTRLGRALARLGI